MRAIVDDDGADDPRDDEQQDPEVVATYLVLVGYSLGLMASARSR